MVIELIWWLFYFFCNFFIFVGIPLNFEGMRRYNPYSALFRFARSAYTFHLEFLLLVPMWNFVLIVKSPIEPSICLIQQFLVLQMTMQFFFSFFCVRAFFFLFQLCRHNQTAESCRFWRCFHSIHMAKSLHLEVVAMDLNTTSDSDNMTSHWRLREKECN